MTELSELKAKIESDIREIGEMYDQTETALKNRSGPGIEAVKVVVPMMRDTLELLENVMKYVDLKTDIQDFNTRSNFNG